MVHSVASRVSALALRSRRAVRLILHAGTHKTGTTTLQLALSTNRDYLRGQGFHYPNPQPFFGGSTRAHHLVALALTGAWSMSPSDVQRFLAYQAEEADGRSLLLSAEGFERHLHGRDGWTADGYWPLRHRYLDAVAEAFSGFDVTVVVVLRRHDTYAASLYKEIVAKDLYRGTFDWFIDEWREVFDHSRHLEAFRAAFDDVRVVSYHAGHVVQSFCQQFGLTLSPEAGQLWERRSPDTRIVEWMAQRDVCERADQRTFASSDEAAALFPAGSVEPTLWPSSADRDRFLSDFDGPYGPAWFPDPPATLPEPVSLSSEELARIDRAFRRWRDSGIATVR